jgi:UDP-N-acetylmuramate dehydrogenase
VSGAFAALSDRLSGLGVPFRRDVPLGPLTWLGVGGATPILIEPRHLDDLDQAHREAAGLGVRLETLGSGANLFVDDGVLPFAVLRLVSSPFKGIDLREARARVGAGAGLEALVARLLESDLGGMEGLVGIPASVGGALVMNAGGRHGEIAERVRSVTVADAGGLRVLSRAACGFGYRRSSLHGVTVVSAEFDLVPGPGEDFRRKAQEIRASKRETQPLKDASAGCLFKNPPGQSAGRLIDLAGLKGTVQGRAQVSPLHANFIVNLGGATADDIRCLIDRVRAEVRRVHGVDLELEVVRWP